MATAIIQTEGDGKFVKITDQWGNKPIWLNLSPEQYEKLDEGLKGYEEDERDFDEMIENENN